MRGFPVAFLLSLGLAAPASAHHSIAAIYDREKSVEVTGVLTRVELKNPHSMLEVSVPAAGGGATIWTIEGAGVQTMARRGIDAQTLAVGEAVTVAGAPARSSERALWLGLLQTAGGKRFEFAPRYARVAAEP